MIRLLLNSIDSVQMTLYFFIYLLISLRQSPHCHCQTLQHTNYTNYNQGMLSGSVQNMSRERLREIKKRMTSRTRTSQLTKVGLQ